MLVILLLVDPKLELEIEPPHFQVRVRIYQVLTVSVILVFFFFNALHELTYHYFQFTGKELQHTKINSSHVCQTQQS